MSNRSNANTAASRQRVRDDEWPDWVNEQPADFDAGDSGGVYLWHTTPTVSTSVATKRWTCNLIS